MANTPSGPEAGFRKKVWIAASITALLVIFIWIIKAIFNLLLLILAAVLIALYFRGLADLLHRKLQLPRPVSLPVAIISTLLLLLLFFWFTGSRIQQQVTALSDTIPTAAAMLKEKISAHPVGRNVLEKMTSGEQAGKAGAIARSFFTSTFGVLGDIYVVVFLGIFFTASPRVYTEGILKLVPLLHRKQARDIMNRISGDLTRWLKGKLLAMLVVAVLTAIGLLIIGVPMIFALALIAGVLNFIPNFGPLLAMVPAVLVGLLEGPGTAALVAGLYILVQVLESNFITPQIQKKLISIPPALIITAQLFMGILTGGWGILLATPVTVMLIILVHELYIKKQDMPVHGNV
jgi:predicted PurR-regulated permease PerM